MPDRIPNSSEKYKPAITFIIPINLRFSVSTNLDTEQLERFNFQFKTANKNMDMSSMLRKFIFKKLKINDLNGFERLFHQDIENLKNKVYEKVGVEPLTKSFSQIMMEEITKYVKEGNKGD